ncbi:type VI secretion protein ImpA [Spirochaetia bacterium]|nr:type VI secretion protein ImpA [Spirochaetia bacterium]
MIDSEALAVVLEGENPAGAALEYDPLYMEMDSLAVEVPDSHMGESTVEGRGPDWKKLTKNCLELWSKTRDLRVAAYLALAQTALEGLPGLSSAFKLLVFLVQNLWEEMYPRLDPDDDFDPLERLNILAMLSPESDAYNDPVMFILRFRETRLVPSKTYTLRDLMIANNELEAGDKVVDGNLLRAEIMSVPPEEIQAQLDYAISLKESIEALCAAMNEKMKDNSISMDSLAKETERLITFYNAQQGLGTQTGGDEASAAAEGAVPGAAAINLQTAAQANSRTEALMMLRKGAEYFQKQEPNSPIPLLVSRALRFADMNFIDLLADIAPDAVSRGRDILGVKSSENG